MTHNQPPALDDFVDKGALLTEVKGHLVTEQSLNRFVRCHRDQLAADGALILVAGRLRFHPERFKQSVVEIGARAAGDRARPARYGAGWPSRSGSGGPPYDPASHR